MVQDCPEVAVASVMDALGSGDFPAASAFLTSLGE